MYHKAVSSYCVTYAWLHTGSSRIYLLLISYLISKQPRVNTLTLLNAIVTYFSPGASIQQSGCKMIDWDA